MTKLPLPAVKADCVIFVSILVILTEAPTTLASCGSTIRPTMRPCSTCATMERTNNELMATKIHTRSTCVRPLDFMAHLKRTYFFCWGLGQLTKGRTPRRTMLPCSTCATMERTNNELMATKIHTRSTCVRPLDFMAQVE